MSKMPHIRRIYNNPFLHIALIVLVGALAYSNTLDVPFHFDDFLNIVENPLIKDFSYFAAPSHAEGVQQSELFLRRYVGYLSFALNYHFGGYNVTGYHVVNLAIHLLTALMVYALFALTFRTPNLRHSKVASEANLIAMCTALVFVAHPIQTQAVTYIVQRFTSLAAFFYLASMVCYIAARLSDSKYRRGVLIALFIVSAALAIKTKENAFTLPLAIAMYEYGFFRGSRLKRLIYVLPIFVVLLIAPVGLIEIEHGIEEGVAGVLSAASAASREEGALERHHYFYTQCSVIVTYLGLMLLPVKQNLDYDYPIYESFMDPRVFWCFLLLAGILLSGGFLFHRVWKVNRGARLVAYGIFMFFLGLSIESSIFPIRDVIFEHRLYLPSVGLISAICVGLFLVANRTLPRPWAVGAPTAIIVVASLVLGMATYERNKMWQSRVTLWEDIAEKSPTKARPHHALGVIYHNRGDMEHALEHIMQALSTDPANPEIHYIAGKTYYKSEKAHEAVRHFKAAIMLAPEVPHLNVWLAEAYDSMGEHHLAAGSYHRAIRLDPENVDAYRGLGEMEFALSHYDEAVKAFRQLRRLGQMTVQETQMLAFMENELLLERQARARLEAQKIEESMIEPEPDQPQEDQTLILPPAEIEKSEAEMLVSQNPEG